MTSQISRNSLTSKTLTGSNSILFTLNKYKRSSFKNKKQIFKEEENQIIQEKIRRKSCYCSECGNFSNFQFKQLNINIPIQQFISQKRNTNLSQSTKIISISRRASIIFQRHHSRMNTIGESQLAQVYNLSPSRQSPIKQKGVQIKLMQYLQNELPPQQQFRKNHQLQLNLISNTQTHRELEQQNNNKLLIKSPQTARKSKPDIRPYLSHLKLKPLYIKQQNSHIEI